jgi:hypothetical protein
VRGEERKMHSKRDPEKHEMKKGKHMFMKRIPTCSNTEIKSLGKERNDERMVSYRLSFL